MLDHELRHVLNDEIHGRPGLAVVAPARITHLAFTLAKGDSDPLLQVIKLWINFGISQQVIHMFPQVQRKTLEGLSFYWKIFFFLMGFRMFSLSMEH